MTDIIVSLSAIPPRFRDLDPTLRSILSQRDRPAAVELWIPESYRRFPDWDGALPAVPAGVTIRRTPSDLGPATKILPAVRAHAGRNVELLFCDDDKIYDPGWIGRFRAARAAHPDAAITEGDSNQNPDIPLADRPANRLPRAEKRRRDWRYRLLRILSLTLYKPRRFVSSGYVDIFAGFAGVMIRPDFFGPEVHDIPDILWTVDDVWLSGNLELNGRGIWLNAEDHHVPGAPRSGDVAALADLVYQDHGRVAADTACIRYYQDTYGIWLSRAEAARRQKAAGA